MIISIGSDHTGIDHKCLIKNFLKKKGYKIMDFGFNERNGKKVDYPDFIHPTVKYVNDGIAHFGIVICGTGNGAAMIANKYKRIRAALVWNKEITVLARKHNDANVISLPARFIKKSKILEIIKIFFITNFDEGRHRKRIDKIPINS
ncbi:RpiB/LacA/LacB family sugar-phosphate isomerase [Blattabacterium cuenoti]|uniref:RpiB/LacA/LacB family sugar-phosphate isomerase n=1 Tax=Blattabacterium cuenoti TaxID=1653831 RepID=UPI00163C2207|nr:RpiB/LacA/LacB family sugar-phosphate isomerase [Blattabacterium cuenoti]